MHRKIATPVPTGENFFRSTMIHLATPASARLAAVFSAGIALALATPAHAGGSKNEIRDVSIEDRGSVTEIRLRGSGTPTFSVYRLERPTRVVVDVAQATLAESVR